MLELIVLGQIPGTNIYINYTAFVVVLFAVFLTVDLTRTISHIKILHKQLIPHKKPSLQS